MLQLLDNIKEAKEVLAASRARGDADPDAEPLGGFEARAYSEPLSVLLPSLPHYTYYTQWACAYVVQKALASQTSNAEQFEDTVQPLRIRQRSIVRV